MPVFKQAEHHLPVGFPPDVPAAATARFPRVISGSLMVAILYATVVLHIAAPKGGFKWEDIPVTWGDISFGMLLWGLLYHLRRALSLPRRVKILVGFLLGGCIFFAFRILAQSDFQLRFALQNLGRFVPLTLYPLIFVAIILVMDTEARQRKLWKLVWVSLGLVLLYAILQKAFGDYNVVIPGLTANLDDASLPDFLSLKSNVIGMAGEVKLTSTYQNGNLLGVNLLIFIPLAIALSQRRLVKLLIVGAGLFTLAFAASRSVWVGAVLMGLAAIQLGVRRVLPKIALAVLLSICVTLFVFYVPVARTRILEMHPDNLVTLGGRLEPAAVLWRESIRDANVSAFIIGPDVSTEKRIVAQGGGAYEIFYLALYEIAGVVGILVWFTPIAFSLSNFYKCRADFVMRAVLIGLVSWLLVALVEGAFWLPPTAFNLWTLVGIGWLRLQSLQDFAGGPMRHVRAAAAA